MGASNESSKHDFMAGSLELVQKLLKGGDIAVAPKAGQSSNVYRIGELAKTTNTTTRTLRYYEELGLLEPIRNTSGQRLYSEDSLNRLKVIHELKSGGFSLIEVKRFFESWNEHATGAQAAEATLPLVQGKLNEIAQLQKQLAKLHDDLGSLVSFLAACRTCDMKPSRETCGDCDRHEVSERTDVIEQILPSRTSAPRSV